MAYIHLFFLIACLLTISSSSSASRNLLNSDPLTTPNYQLLEYHKGPLLTGPVRVNLIWYGKFTPRQRSIVADFVTSLSSSSSSKPKEHQPSVATWWDAIDKYYHLAQSSSHNNNNNKIKKHHHQQKPLSLSLGSQILDEDYSLGKSLTTAQIEQLAAKGTQSYAVNVVLTASDVSVDGFCMSRCGSHSAAKGSVSSSSKKRPTFAYIWVGNSETQCPGQCAWPFHQPIYGPQTPPLVSPNNDVAIDGIIINLATLMAGTATNPFGTGYFQGPKEAPLEAASACPGVYGKGAYPGFPGQLLVDRTTGASYNAQGVNGRKYLLPALYDPSTSKCSTLV